MLHDICHTGFSEILDLFIYFLKNRIDLFDLNVTLDTICWLNQDVDLRDLKKHCNLVVLCCKLQYNII